MSKYPSVIYIASPYTRGDVGHNIRQPFLAAEQLRAKGWLPLLPLVSHFWNLISPHEYEYWMSLDLSYVAISDAVLRLPGESPGADREVAEAERLGVDVYYDVDDAPVVGKSA